MIIKFTKPLHTAEFYYEDKLLDLYIGVSDNTNAIKASNPAVCDVFIALITGDVKIECKNTGNIETFVAGESFVIPKEHDMQWHILKPLLKFCVIYTPKITPIFKTINNIPALPRDHHSISINEHNDTPWQATSDGFYKKVQYQSQNQKLTAGVWQGKDFKTGIIAFPYHEFILVKQGCLICIDEQGEKHNIKLGEALFIPQGVRCAWEVYGAVSLQFVQIKS